MWHADEAMEDEASENAPPFASRHNNTSNAKAGSGGDPPPPSSLSSSRANQNKQQNQKHSTPHDDSIFRDAYVTNAALRTPLYPMPPQYQETTQSQPSDDSPPLPRSTRAVSSSFGASKHESTMKSQEPSKQQQQQQQSRRPNHLFHRRESLDNMPIDSDTLLPISSMCDKDQQSLITSATAPASHILVAQQQHRQSQQQQQEQQQSHPFDLASAITTSPTLLFTDDDASYPPTIPDLPVGHSHELEDTTTLRGEQSSGWISTRSSKSQLFGEDFASVGTTSRMSLDCHRHHHQNVSHYQEERFSYSPSASDFEDVELQAAEHEDEERHRALSHDSSTRHIHTANSQETGVMNRLPVIGGPQAQPEPTLSRQQQLKKAALSVVPTATVSKVIQQVGEWSQNEIVPVARTAKRQAKRLVHKYRGPPPSPHTKNMNDLNYLRHAHRTKVDKLTDIEHEDHFDFALVLTPQEVYSYWSDLLDFRVEQLGEDAAQAINEATTLVSEYGSIAPSGIMATSSSSSSSPRSGLGTMPSTSSDATSPDGVSPERNSTSSGGGLLGTVESSSENGTPPSLHRNSYSTPATGMHRRRNRHSVDSVDSSAVPMALTTPNNHAGIPFSSTPYSTSSRTRRTLSLASPYRIATSTQKSVVPRLSLFERALGPIDFTPSSKGGLDGDDFLGPEEEILSNSNTKPDSTPNTVVSTNRRRWGPHSLNGALQTPNCMMSPPIRSLSHGGSSSVILKRAAAARSRASTANFSVPEERPGDEEESVLDMENPNNVRIEDIPSHVIPRGIAARTNGMLQFLSALKRGIVVRRHRSGKEPVFCKISSNDGGDTVNFEYVEAENAMNAFKEQRVRYNRSSAGHAVTSRSIAQPWSYPEDNDDESVFQNHNFSVPDFIAAKHFRDKMQREQGIARKVTNAVAKVTRSGQFRASDMVAVHPARHDDPRSDQGELGTITLRKSKAEYSTEHTFSIVCRVVKRLPGAASKTIESFENKWYKGEGNDVQFKYLDFEAATEGEYWLIFRGFLLLHRDAAAGRFAVDRTAGIGSHVNRLALGQREQADLDVQNTLHQDEFLEPITPSILEKLVVKARKMDTTFMEGQVRPGAVPPPSDYFLGFKSPGTQIWSRLRQAGLETHRVYNIDTRSVLIKIRCPEDRLMDVAEVLRLKLKTTDGDFAPFREDSIDHFRPISEDVEALGYSDQTSSLFRSSHRQTIIDFIIGSRIRDSGAELDQTTDLGRMVNARVPLHVPQKLDNLYNAWFYYWRKENWRGRDGCGLRIELDAIGTTKEKKMDTLDISEADKSVLEEFIPNRMYRIFVGCFFQPLDSIEEYFGEKVAFYFAWLQHLSVHLMVLTCAGLIVLACMLISQTWDHAIRPYWSVFVMLWSFTVLINWRKRSNFLAYRWGTMDYKEQETTRPQYKGKYSIDPITNEWVVRYPTWKRWLKYLISFPLTLGFTFVSLFIILLFHANRDLHMSLYVEEKTNPDAEPFHFSFSIDAIGADYETVPISREFLKDPTFLGIVFGLPSVLGLCLPLLNFILMNVSYALNDFENYRTHSEYRTSLIIKVFAFRFVCYFASLYYYAFTSQGDDQAIENGLLRVASGVLIYTTVAQWWGLFLQIYFPLIVYNIRMKLRRKRLLRELADVEMEEEELLNSTLEEQEGEESKIKQIRLVNKRLLLDQAQDKIWMEALRPQHDSFPGYITAVVQFAYVTCFSVVLPITPFICLLNYLALMRLDAYKVCKVRRRPLSEKTGGIGVWEHLLHIVVVISVLTNCWLLGFTHYQFKWIGETEYGQIGLFIFVVCFEHIMLLIKYAMHAVCSTLPRSVRDSIRREQHQQTKQRNVKLQEKKRRTQFQKSASFRTNSARSLRSSATTEKVLRWGPTEEAKTKMSEF